MRGVVLISLIASLGACAHAPAVGSDATAATDPLRLPKTTRPTAYALSLDLDPSQPTFTGLVRIQLHLDGPTRRLRLHGEDLQVREAVYLAGESRVPLEYRQLTPDGASELRAGSELPAGDGTLEIAWTAKFGTRVDGLYSVRDGGESYAFTQFESIAARKMFPCFDEPGFKTPFEVTLRVRGADVAISNTPVAEEKTGEDGRRTVRFARTAPLPTYLLALAVGPFDVVPGPDVPPNETRPLPLPLRGVAAKGKGRLLQYALAHTGELVTILEKYFGLAYPWEKLDLIAVPDFGPGAMENVGAITFKEFLLLLDGDQAPPDQRRAFASVTAHELAHQWFGDLVTMEWWDDIWLNEAFASWMSARVMQTFDPSMKSDVGLIANMQELMNVDSLAAARRIRQPIQTVGDIFNAFDGITYTKGAGVIGMFETWVGPEKFRQGLHRYFEQHRFSTGTTADFLASISEAAGKDITPAFLSFLDQPGVPLLRLQRSCEGGQEKLQVDQERFRPLGSVLAGEASWRVPFCYRRPDQKADCALIESAHATVPVGPSCSPWLLPNTGGTGYYRFAFDEGSAAALIAARAALSTTEQLAVIDSVTSAERAGRIDLAAALRLLTPFAAAEDRRVAASPMGVLAFVRNEVADEALRPLVEQRARDLYGPVARRLEPLRDDESRMFLRQVLSFRASVGQDSALRAQARAVGQHFLHPETPPPPPTPLDDPALLELALNVTMEDGDDAVLDATVARLKGPVDPLIRLRLVGALAHARGPLGARARALALDPALKVSEVIPFLRGQFGRRETREEAWAWFLAEGDKVIARLDEKHGSALPGLPGTLCSMEQADEVQRYFAARIGRMPGGERTLARAVESIRLCAARKAAGEKALQSFRVALAGAP